MAKRKKKANQVAEHWPEDRPLFRPTKNGRDADVDDMLQSMADDYLREFPNYNFGSNELNIEIAENYGSTLAQLELNSYPETKEMARALLREIEALQLLRKAASTDEAILCAGRICELRWKMAANEMWSRPVRSYAISRANLAVKDATTKAECVAARKMFGTNKAAADYVGISAKQFGRIMKR